MEPFLGTTFNYDPTVTLGHLMTAGAVVITLIGWGIRMQLNMRIMTRQMDRIVEDLDKVRVQLAALADQARHD